MQRLGPSGPYYAKKRKADDALPLVDEDSTATVIVKFVPKDELDTAPTTAAADKDNDGAADGNDEKTSAKARPAVLLAPVEIPVNSTTEQLQTIINTLLKHDEARPYSFFVNEDEIVGRVSEMLAQQKMSTEAVLPILYQPQAIFRVRRVNRCTASLPGHTEPILHVHFSPDGRHLASGAGDATVRLWDVDTETPRLTLRGHENWVMAVCWSPTGHLLASASMDKSIRVWDPETGKRVGKPLTGHTKYVTCLAWEPLHACAADGEVDMRLASGGKDGQIKVWDTKLRRCLTSMSGHTMGIQSLVWGGEGLLYSASQDRTIRVWNTTVGASSGKLVRVLEGHAHWVNTLSLSTSYVLRTGPYDHTRQTPPSREVAVQRARARYDTAMSVCKSELLVSGSDDFTLILWEPTRSKKPIIRMTGHQQPVNYVCFSPDSRYIASASFDNSVRLWNGMTGKFIAVFRGHVQSVYQCIFSPDSRMLVSSSKDSTIKVWDVRQKALKSDLPGHADEVFACDWSPDGLRVASGGKDALVRVWRA